MRFSEETSERVKILSLVSFFEASMNIENWIFSYWIRDNDTLTQPQLERDKTVASNGCNSADKRSGEIPVK